MKKDTELILRSTGTLVSCEGGELSGINEVLSAADPRIIGTGAALELTGSIRLLFYLTVPEEELSSTVHMELNGRSVDVTASDGYLREDGVRVYRFPVYSTEMSDQVTLTVVGKDGSQKQTTHPAREDTWMN